MITEQVQQALHRSSWPQELKVFYATDATCDDGAGEFQSSPSALMSRASAFGMKARPSTGAGNTSVAGSLQSLQDLGSRIWPSLARAQQACPAEATAPCAVSGSMAAEGSVIMKRSSVAVAQVRKASFRGLRVRMGVASGTIVPEGAITRATLFKLAKGESSCLPWA